MEILLLLALAAVLYALIFAIPSQLKEVNAKLDRLIKLLENNKQQ
jgi:hypothetical protein